MRRRRAIAALLAATGGVLLAASTSAAFSALAERGGGPPAPTPGPVDPPADVPVLTSEERERAVRIVAADARVQRVLGGLAYSVRQVGPWTTLTGGKKLGAAITIAPTAPVSVPMTDWPVVSYDSSQPGHAYRRASLPMAAAHVREFMLAVDLARGDVVAIQPGSGAVVTVGPGAKRVPVHGGGE